MDNVLTKHAEMALTAAKHSCADTADVLAVRSRDISTSIRQGKPESIEQAESIGLGLRVFVGQSSATLSTSDLSNDAIMRLAEQAVAIARAAPTDPYAALADAAKLAREIPPLDADDFMPEMLQLQAYAREAESAGLATKGITNSEGGDASAGTYEKVLLTSHGFQGSYTTSRYALSASMIAGEASTMQRDYDYAYVTHFADLPDAASIGKEAAARAVARLSPRKIASQTAAVYFEPRAGRQLLSAFASAISGSAIARGTSFLKDMLGKKVFGDTIRITDDPLMARGLSSRAFDAEGVAVRTMNLVENGVLTSWLLDTRSANQLGLTTTGHAARGLASAPSPSPSNLYLAAGDKNPNALMRDIGDGLYVTETISHGVNLITGDFSVGASGFWVEKGVRVFPVSEVTIAGNLRDMFKELIPANDLQFRYSINVPTLAIPSLTIAGS